MCFTADRTKTLAARIGKEPLSLFKLARVVKDQLRAPWHVNVILGEISHSSPGHCRVLLKVPQDAYFLHPGAMVIATAFAWLRDNTLPDQVTAADGFYVSTSKEAIIQYAKECDLAMDGLVILPIRANPWHVGVVSADGLQMTISPEEGQSIMMPFAKELENFGEKAFLTKYSIYQSAESNVSAS